MKDKRIIFEIHRLNDAGLSGRQIAKQLRLGRNTVKKYLANPENNGRSPSTQKTSKLAPFHEMINQFLEQEPTVRVPVVLQRLQSKGFNGKITIVREYIRKRRGRLIQPVPFIRFESLAGQQMQIDWGHFGSLAYGNTHRKLYALAVTECYSRMLYVEFSHSQKQEALHRCILNAFKFFGGTPEEMVVDNMLTAVLEREGSLVRYNEAFLDFLRVFKVVPKACNVRSPHEKGKIEKTIGYIRYNFWPLRTFTDLADVQLQCNDWRDTIANIRIHQTTGEKPHLRFAQVKLRPLPELLPDCREITTVKVHKDFAVIFDGNTYTVPPWSIGKQVTLKADNRTITIYYREKPIAGHLRSYERKKRIETQAHVEQVKKIQKRLWQDREISLFTSLGQEAREYLEALVNARHPVKKNISKLLELKDEYGVESLLYAIRKALQYKAFGSDYIKNILYQEMTPQYAYEPIRVKNESLNRLRLAEPSLADYDAIVKNEDSL